MINEERAKQTEQQRKKLEKTERDNKRHKQLTQKLMRNKDFMDWVWFYLNQAMCDQDVFTGNATTYYNCGVKTAAVYVRKVLKEIDIDAYHEAEKRNRKRNLNNE